MPLLSLPSLVWLAITHTLKIWLSNKTVFRDLWPTPPPDSGKFIQNLPALIAFQRISRTFLSRWCNLILQKELQSKRLKPQAGTIFPYMVTMSSKASWAPCWKRKNEQIYIQWKVNDRFILSTPFISKSIEKEAPSPPINRIPFREIEIYFSSSSATASFQEGYMWLCRHRILLFLCLGKPEYIPSEKSLREKVRQSFLFLYFMMSYLKLTYHGMMIHFISIIFDCLYSVYDASVFYI